MAIINLRDFYPYYTADSFIEVPDKVAEAMAECWKHDVYMTDNNHIYASLTRLI